jgi:hypothetical protein
VKAAEAAADAPQSPFRSLAGQLPRTQPRYVMCRSRCESHAMHTWGLKKVTNCQLEIWLHVRFCGWPNLGPPACAGTGLPLILSHSKQLEALC